MIQLTDIPAPSPQELWGIFEGHNMLSGAFRANPALVGGLCDQARFFIWHVDENPVALHIETRSLEPGVLDILIVPEDKGLGKERRTEIVELGKQLRGMWFDRDGFGRVQAIVPASRVNMQRIARALGFIEETKRGLGMRGAVSFGKKSEAMLVYGLLPTDPVRQFKEAENAYALEVGE